MKLYKIGLYILFFSGYNLVSMAQTKDSARYSVQRLSINSKQSDFSPFLYDKKLYFSSGRENVIGIKYYSIQTNQELIDVFLAEKIDSIHFKKPKSFSEINTKYNDGPACINKNGKQLFVTGNDLKRASKQNKKPLSIFLSKKENDKWSKAEPLSFCLESANYCHPTFSVDGQTLIFSSDVKGGFGGMDLYYAKLENGKWTIPRNLGAKINGISDEVFPFISENNILYFSTNRKNGYGGLDIYTFDLKDVKNSDIQILELPINSMRDDFGIWLDSAENTGYFSSNRDSTKSDDIFYVKNKYPDFENCTPFKKETYCYTFFEESTMLTQDTLGMIYEWDFGDGTKKRGLEVKHCFATTGNYLVQLNIIEKASGNLFYNELSYEFLIEEPKRLFIDCADTLIVSKNFELDIKNSLIPNHTIKDVYWFFGDGKFTEGSTAKHTYTKEGTYNIKLGVTAINDSTKKTEKFCTQKTILVKDSLWIVKNKFVLKPLSKIDSVTYAFAADSLWQTKYKPYFNYTPSSIDSLNYMTELDSLWNEKHKRNLSYIPSTTEMLYNVTEGDNISFRVYLGSSKKKIPITANVFKSLYNIKQYKEKNGYAYTSGNFKKIKNIFLEYENAKRKGFKNAAVVGFYNDSLIANQEKSLKGIIVDENKIQPEGELPTKPHSKNILFDFDKAVIDKQYFKYLDSLTGLLQKNKKFELIILAATDSVGSNAYNNHLAEKRATAIQQYFIQRGIIEDRLDINTFGENMPTEYDPKKISVISNRRVEILLVKKQ